MATAKHHLLVIGDIGGHGAERNRQAVEIADVAATYQQALEQQCQVLALDHAQRQAEAAVITKAQALLDQEVAVILLAAKRHVGARWVIGKHLPPIHGQRHLLEFGDAVARGVQAADHRAHAGAGNGVDAHALLFQRLEHPDMGQPPCGAAR